MGAHDTQSPVLSCGEDTERRQLARLMGLPVGSVSRAAPIYQSASPCRLCAQLLQAVRVGYCYSCLINEGTEVQRDFSLYLSALSISLCQCDEPNRYTLSSRELISLVGKSDLPQANHPSEITPHLRKRTGFSEGGVSGWRREGSLWIRWSRKPSLKM